MSATAGWALWVMAVAPIAPDGGDAGASSEVQIGADDGISAGVDPVTAERSSLPLALLLDEWEREGRKTPPLALATRIDGLPTAVISRVREEAFEQAPQSQLDRMSAELTGRTNAIGVLTHALREGGIAARRDGRIDEANQIAGALRRIATDNRGLANRQVELVAELAEARAKLVESAGGRSPQP